MKYIVAIFLFCVSDLVTAKTIGFRTQALQPQVRAFVQALEKLGVKDIKRGKGGSSDVTFLQDNSLPRESYVIKIEKGKVWVRAADTVAAAYAASDLVRRAHIAPEGTVNWEEGAWTEVPDFPYRSFLVDMGRNPHSPETLRQVVDMMWFYRGNYLQLHLTDDQLFSWPSKAYPELYSSRAGWTLEDFRALEEYSQARGVTIVPELEVPGHSSILRRKRPDVFGENPVDLATSPKAQKGAETLIAEMLEVFQSTPYMHIGADEVYGVSQEDQRKFINRLNQFIKKLGRRTVVWEGPAAGNLEKGQTKVETDVIHMAWESKYYPMTDMVKAGYQIVNASWDPFYIVDHYPRNNFTGVPIDACYHADLRRMKNVDPGIKSFAQPQWAETTDSILGFCMPWWEGREQNLLPMCLKRYGAAATRAWDYDSTLAYEQYATREEQLLNRLELISGFMLPEMPTAPRDTTIANLAYGAKVTPSKAANQPYFVPGRLTNGITDRFDIFLGYPTKPEPLLIDIELLNQSEASRIRIYEISSGNGWEKYRLYVSRDGKAFEKVGESTQGKRGKKTFLEHRFPKTEIKVVRIETDGFEDFTFPSFSRLSEVQVFAE